MRWATCVNRRKSRRPSAKAVHSKDVRNMFSSAEMQLIYKVANTPIQMFPFPHVLVHDVFPQDFYRTLREHLPPGSAYKPLKALGRVYGNYPETRVVLPLTPDEVAALPEPYRSFWHETAGWLLGGPLGQIVLQKFSSLLARRFKDPEAVEYENEALVVQDRTTYALGPHTDLPAKVFSFLFYLPADASKPHLGTSMYVPKDPSFICPGGPHHAFEKFERMLTMPYVPNTLFGFMKTPNAFHGVEPITEPEVERALLLFDIKVKDVPAAPAPPETNPKTQFSF